MLLRLINSLGLIQLNNDDTAAGNDNRVVSDQGLDAHIPDSIWHSVIGVIDTDKANTINFPCFFTNLCQSRFLHWLEFVLLQQEPFFGKANSLNKLIQLAIVCLSQGPLLEPVVQLVEIGKLFPN